MSSYESETEAQKKYRKSIEREGYLLWVADGKQEGKSNYYWTLAIEKVNNQFNKEFLETYQIYRDHIKHEDNLGNQRLSFFIASQSFLFFPYFNVLAKYKDNGFNGYDFFLLVIVCCLGLGTSRLTQSSIQGFVDASSAIALIWKTQCLNYNQRTPGRISYYWYNDKTKDSEIFQDDNQIIAEDSASNKLSFLEINNQQIPNIRYENPTEELNGRIEKYSNQIPKWFMIIWGILLFIPFIPLVSKLIFKTETPDDLRIRVEKILIDEQQNFINDISSELNKKEQTLNDQEREIENIKQHFYDRNDLLNKKEQTLNDQERKIEKLEEDLSTRTSELNEREQTLNDQERKIEKLNEDLDPK